MPYRALDPSLAAPAPVVAIGAPVVAGELQLVDIRDNLSDELGGRESDEAKLNKWINQAYRSLCGMIDITELHASFEISTIEDQYMYLLPNQVAWIDLVSVFDEDDFPDKGRQLSKIDLGTFRRLEDIDSDVLNSYFRHNRTLVLWPPPVAVWPLAIDCKVRPDDLVENTDSPILPSEWFEGLELLAKHRGLRGLKQYKEANATLNDALTVIRPLSDTDAEERGTKDAHMSPAKSSRDLYRRHARRRRFT